MSHFSFVRQDNPFFEMAHAGKRLTHIALQSVLTFAFIFISFILGGIAISAVLNRFSPDGLSTLSDTPTLQGIGFAAELIFTFGLLILLIAAWVSGFEKRSFATLGLQPHSVIQKYARGLLIGLLMFAASVGINSVLGYMQFEAGLPTRQGVAALGGVLFALTGWLVQGAAEEILSRGWLMQVIGARYRPSIGVIVSSAVFTVLHSLNPNLSVVAIMNLFLFGLFAALFTLREGSLWGISAVHSAWNWAQGNVFGLEVSGTNTLGGMLFNLQEVGPDLVTGGAFGPEGGLAVTVVLIASIVVIVLKRKS
jgi:hypothetical protein